MSQGTSVAWRQSCGLSHLFSHFMARTFLQTPRTHPLCQGLHLFSAVPISFFLNIYTSLTLTPPKDWLESCFGAARPGGLCSCPS